MLKSVSVVSVCIACAVGGAGSAFAWDVEHDEIAQLVGESLPAEIKASFDFDDFGVLMAFCHFPDMTEWEPRRWRTVDDYAPHVGPDDRAILAAAGCGGYWAHSEKGKATLMTLLARAFGRGDHRVAAFYLSVLTHPVGDESALNHPTILNFVHYCHYQGVAFGTRKVEAGAKNIFGFRSDGDVVRRARAKLKGYRPSAPAVAGFRAQQLALCVRAVDQSAYAAEKEVAIGFGRLGAAEALADLVAMQVRAILDIAWTCWVNRAVDAALPAADFQACFDRDAARATKALDPGRQAVFADLFDASRNPKAPKGTVALVCEALGLRSSGAQSYAGRLVLGACGRTLRDAGYAVKAYDFRNLAAGTLSAAETPTLIVAAGFHAPEAEVARALAAYRDAGGRIVYVSGQDPGGSVRGHGDPFGITGFGAALADRAPEELPVSPPVASRRHLFRLAEDGGRPGRRAASASPRRERRRLREARLRAGDPAGARHRAAGVPRQRAGALLRRRAQGERDVAAGLPALAVPLLGRHVPRLRRAAARRLRRAAPPPGGGDGVREQA